MTALLLAGCSGSASGSGGSKQTGPISVGVVAPFTGPAAQFGHLLSAPCYAGTLLINRAGGVLGHNLNCVSIDDTGDPADAVPNVTKAVATTKNFDMAIGLESNTAATTVPIVNRAKIPFFTTNGLVSMSKNNYPYYWRATASDDANGAAFGVWANQKGFKRLGIVFQDNIGAEGNLPGVQAAGAKNGQNVVINVTIPGDAASYSSVVTRVIQAKPDALIFAADPQSAATFLSEYKQLNSGTIPPMVTATDSLVPDFYNAITKSVGADYLVNNVYLVGSYFQNTTPAFDTYKTGIDDSPQNSAIKDVIVTVGPPASAYDGINVMALAMIMANSTIGSDYNQDILKIVSPHSGAVVVHNFADGKKALQQGKQIQYVGVIGTINFNRYHNFSGQFAANVFNSDGSSKQVGVISG
ncbi:MAG: amino acid ABC transporter substrate-binding protein, partial [Acidimicrobiaceae bacterium]|nr:amino acid ABC transporter substrate-binding protein [Acidimicrobiaceae bacterium]